MAFRWVVNAGLLAIPIGTTIGVLVGIDAQRQASGQQPLFAGGGNNNGGTGNGGGSSSGGTGSGGGNGGSGGSDNDIKWNDYCQTAYGISPYTKGQEYLLNPNQWGIDGGITNGVSRLCMNVTTFDNGTYATNTTAPEFAVTWNYTQGNPDQPVHAFPNIMINGTTLPVHVNSLNNITLDVAWTYGLGNEPVATTDIKSLDTASLNANVAVDMFLDSTQELSSDSEKAKYEIMVWLARFGTSTDPYGKQTSITQTVNGVNFDLWSGTKTTTNQIVLTWVVPDGTTAQNFTGDLRTLLDRPTGIAEGEYPSATDYLGHFSFGSEAYYIDTNVTFHVPNFAIDIRT